MRVVGWNAPQMFKEVEDNVIEAANELMDDMADNARRMCPVGTMTKEGTWKKATLSFIPTRRRGRKIPLAKRQRVTFEAQQYSGRYPGQLRDTIRRVNKYDRPGSIRVIAGNRSSGYARFLEFGTAKMRARPFMRPAFQQLKRDLIARIQDKVCMLPGHSIR